MLARRAENLVATCGSAFRTRFTCFLAMPPASRPRRGVDVIHHGEQQGIRQGSSGRASFGFCKIWSASVGAPTRRIPSKCVGYGRWLRSILQRGQRWLPRFRVRVLRSLAHCSRHRSARPHSSTVVAPTAARLCPGGRAAPTTHDTLAATSPMRRARRQNTHGAVSAGGERQAYAWVMSRCRGCPPAISAAGGILSAPLDQAAVHPAVGLGVTNLKPSAWCLSEHP